VGAVGADGGGEGRGGGGDGELGGAVDCANHEEIMKHPPLPPPNQKKKEIMKKQDNLQVPICNISTQLKCTHLKLHYNLKKCLN
jgi:hypothetical protein